MGLRRQRARSHPHGPTTVSTPGSSAEGGGGPGAPHVVVEGHGSGADVGRDVRRWVVLLSISTGAFMSNVDTTAVTVALPTMAREFGVGLNALQWVVSAYLLTTTAALPTFGRLADMVGRKLILNTGMVVFVAASLLVALAPSFGVLIAARAVQGLGGAMFMSATLATAVSTFPAQQRGRVLGMIGSIVAAGTLIGPGVGGLLTGAFGWRSIFLINVPIGLAGALGTFLLLPRDAGSGVSVRRFDLPGAVSFAAAATCLLLALSRGSSAGWSDITTLVLLAAALVLLGLFVLRELRTPHPLVQLRLLARRVFGLGTAAALLCYVLTIFPALLFPLYLQEVLGWSTGVTGLAMTLQAVAMLLVSPLAGSWSDRSGPRRPALTALCLLAVAMVATATLGADARAWSVGLLLVLFGAAFGMFISPNSSAVVGDVSPEQLGAANGAIATVRNLGRAVGVAVVVALFQLRAGTAEISGGRPDVFLAGFHGAFLGGAALACAAFAAVLAMYRRRAQ